MKSSFLGALLLIGCSLGDSSRDPILDKLADQGPILVAPDNPYLAANQFLTKQMAESSELTGFLKLKGYPAAFELRETSFGPLIMTFYYTSNQERYDLEKSGRTWIISGPFSMDSAAIAKLNIPNSIPSRMSTPVVQTPSTENAPKGKIEKIKLPQGEKNPRLKATPSTVTETPSPESEPTQIPTAIPTIGFISPEPQPTPVEVTSALSKDSAKPEQAELSPRGDLVHYVTMPGETLSVIARWYTQDRENAGKIGRLNRLKNSDNLQIGDTIVIPSYMIKNKNRLQESDLKSLLTTAQKEKTLGSPKR